MLWGPHVGLGPKEDRRGCGLLSRVAPSSAYSPASQAVGSPAWGFRPAGRTAEGGDLPSLTQASSSLLLSLLLIPLFWAGELVVRKACLWLRRNLLPGKAMRRVSPAGEFPQEKGKRNQTPGIDPNSSCPPLRGSCLPTTHPWGPRVCAFSGFPLGLPWLDMLTCWYPKPPSPSLRSKRPVCDAPTCISYQELLGVGGAAPCRAASKSFAGAASRETRSSYFKSRLHYEHFTTR